MNGKVLRATPVSYCVSTFYCPEITFPEILSLLCDAELLLLLFKNRLVPSASTALEPCSQ